MTNANESNSRIRQWKKLFEKKNCTFGWWKWMKEKDPKPIF